LPELNAGEASVLVLPFWGTSEVIEAEVRSLALLHEWAGGIHLANPA
jgi:hypothetical protein